MKSPASLSALCLPVIVLAASQSTRAAETSARENLPATRVESNTESYTPRLQVGVHVVRTPAGSLESARPTAGSTPEEQSQGMTVEVQQAPATVIVEQPAPKVVVERQAPRVTVEQPPPQVTVTQPEPEVTVSQERPRVEVVQQDPEIVLPPPTSRVLEDELDEVNADAAAPEQPDANRLDADSSRGPRGTRTRELDD